MINKVRVEEAIGMPLAHDITKVVPGSSKGPAFRRGHIVKTEDIPEFLRIGKEHVFVLDLEKGQVHEEEAALRIANAVMGEGLTHSLPSEGKVDLTTTSVGLIKIDVAALEKINMLDEIAIATVHSNTVCKADMTVASMRITPLYIPDEKLTRMEQIARESQPVIRLASFKLKNTGLIIVGNEVLKGRIQDRFSPVMRKKVEALGCTVNNQVIVPDDPDIIAQTILAFKEKGSEVILCCGGMSVDPDDVTREGVQRSGAQERFYGLPVIPGAMSLYATLGNAHVFGVPAGTLHSSAVAFDMLFPIILTGEALTFEETRKLGHGGLCLKCTQCSFPVCPFCK